jgi:radical SAM superfamily enzyme YgiQ (UPF0313 family)
MRLLLINPRFPESFWSFKWAIQEILPGKRAVNPPLGLATLAALCPPDWRVDIVDENVEAIPLEPAADIVGICGMGVQLPRQRELLAYYRRRGHYVVAGGSYASLCPEEYAPLADTVIAGEAEYIWPQFCEDFVRGAPQHQYRETGTVALTDSPTPRFDLLKLDRYSYATLQYSRGCPFRCEFCDIIVMFGRQPRMKRLEQVGRELDALRQAGIRSVFFVDDNLIGHRAQAKALLRFLQQYQQEHQYAFSFGTEVSLNLAQDRELLERFQAANFGWVFIGIESTDPASLKETGKTQNLREDPLISIRRLYAHGIDVLGGFIVGFDHDTLETFDHQHQFITDAGIQSAMVGLLTALPRTPLHARLQREGRLRPTGGDSNNTQATTNIIPRNMSPAAMAEAYQNLYRRLLSDQGIERRIRNKGRFLRAPQYQSGYPPTDRLRIIGRLLIKGILPGGVGRLARFLRTLPVLSPARLPLVISDWIVGLSMREFARRHLAGESPKPKILERRVASVRAVLGAYLAQGNVTLALLQEAAAPHLDLAFRGWVDARLFRRAAPRLARLLKHTGAHLTLRLDRLPTPCLEDVRRLLDQLARYGDRVFIVVDEQWRPLIPVDSSVFHLVLAGPDE